MVNGIINMMKLLVCFMTTFQRLYFNLKDANQELTRIPTINEVKKPAFSLGKTNLQGWVWWFLFSQALGAYWCGCV